MSPAYINNQDECEGVINIWKITWPGMEEIMIKIENEEHPGEREIEVYETVKKLIKKNRRDYVKTKIINREPCGELHKYKYDEVTKTTKRMITFKTYYAEKRKENGV